MESLCSHGLAGGVGGKTSLHIRGGLGPQVAGDRLQTESVSKLTRLLIYDMMLHGI